MAGNEEWRQIEELYFAAEEMSRPERAAFLDRRCAGQDELRRKVERLLAAAIEQQLVPELWSEVRDSAALASEALAGADPEQLGAGLVEAGRRVVVQQRQDTVGQAAGVIGGEPEPERRPGWGVSQRCL